MAAMREGCGMMMLVFAGSMMMANMAHLLPAAMPTEGSWAGVALALLAALLGAVLLDGKNWTA